MEIDIHIKDPDAVSESVRNFIYETVGAIEGIMEDGFDHMTEEEIEDRFFDCTEMTKEDLMVKVYQFFSGDYTAIKIDLDSEVAWVPKCE